MYHNASWQEEKRRKSIFMLSSLALHLLLFIILHLAGMGIGKAEKRGDFDLDAIKVINMIAQAKDAMTRKAKSGANKPAERRPKAGRPRKLPRAKVRSVARQRSIAKQIAPKPLEHQPNVPIHEVTERTLEREIKVAKLVIPKETRPIIEKKFFADVSRKIELKEQKLPRKTFTPIKQKKLIKRRIKAPKMLDEVVKKQPSKAIKPLEEATFEVVRKKVVVPVDTPSRKQFARLSAVRTVAPEQRRIEEEKRVSRETRITPQKKQLKRPKKLYTPQEVATPTKRLAFNTAPKSTVLRSAPKKQAPKNVKLDDAPEIKVDLPEGKITGEPLQKIQGTVDGDVTNAFITVNGVTQLLTVVNGKFEAEVSMVKGKNKIEILVFSSRGGVGKQAFNLFFSPLPGAPVITLDSPENGRQGMQEGDEVLVIGTVDDETITQATLLLNGIPLPPMKVVNGVFKRKVFLPGTRATTFRVMAKNKSGVVGYSPLHTVVSGHDIDLLNPRPY